MNAQARKTIVYFILSLMLMGGLAAGLLSLNSSTDIRSKASNDGIMISIHPATQLGTIGSTASIGITINTNNDTISATQLKLAYDPTAIQVLRFVPGSFMPVVLMPEAHEGGILSVTLGVEPTAPFKGSGIIGTLQVKILSAKQSSLTFTHETQVAAIGKTTNALVSASGATIVGTTAETPTLTPTRIPGPSVTPAPTTYATMPREESEPIEQGTSEEYSPFATVQSEIPKQTIFSQILTTILEFFNSLFKKNI